MPQSARILTTTCPKPAVPLEDFQREYGSHSLRLSTKILVYTVVVIPTLLYDAEAETWVLYRKQIRLLERFHQRCLRSILGIRWQDYVSNEEVLKKASLPSMESILLQVQLRLGWPRPKQSSSSSSKKESVIVALQESVTNISGRGSLHMRESAISQGISEKSQV